MKVPFSPPDITEAEIENVIKVLRSGWITTGPATKEFEKRIAEYCGTKRAVCLNSQTACAEMALRLLGVKQGDEVITTAYTYTATASVICHVGATPVIIDTQKDCLEMDYVSLEKAINHKTKAIIAVDVGGIPCDYDRIFGIVENKANIFRAETPMQKAIGRAAIIADAAHSFGSVYKVRRAGSIADFSAFSFHAVKNLTTAEGGALTWTEKQGISDDEIYKTLQLFSLHGQSKDALSKSAAGQWEYDVVGPYYKCNMTDVMAAIGLAQLDRYPKMLKRRKEIIEKYDSAFLPLGLKTLPHFNETHISSGHLYIVRIPGISADERNGIIKKMAEKEISCNVHYKPLPLLTAYKNMGFDIKNYPCAYANFADAITLPLNTCLTDGQIDYVIEQFTYILRDYIKC